MSLTSLLKEKELKTKFKQNFPIPKIKLDGQMLAPPQTNRYSLVGTAFDYVLRFHLKHVFPNAVTHRLVAQESVDHIRFHSGEYALVDGAAVKVDGMPKGKARLDYVIDLFPDAKQIEVTDGTHEFQKMTVPAETVLEAALDDVGRFHKTGIVEDVFLKSCLSLARLDVVLRTGRLFDDTIVVQEDAGDIADLRNLLDVAERAVPKPKHRALLNPVFTKSSMVGGADADMILDNTLIDMKTTKSLKFTQDMYNQLLGYCALDTGKREITHIGIYFSRHGICHTMLVPDDVDKMLQWFKDQKV